MAHSRILQDQLPANRNRRSADALNPAQEKRKAVKLGLDPAGEVSVYGRHLPFGSFHLRCVGRLRAQ